MPSPKPLCCGSDHGGPPGSKMPGPIFWSQSSPEVRVTYHYYCGAQGFKHTQLTTTLEFY